MHQSRKQTIILAVLFTIAALLITTISYAQPPTAVGLIRFVGQSVPQGARLEWATGSETGTAGFVIKRSSNGGSFVELTTLLQANGTPYLDAFVDAQGDVTLGAEYVAIDPTATAGQTYTYQLVEIETNGTENAVATTTVTAGATATPTPAPIGNNPPGGSNPTATSGSNATATPRPSNTSQAGNTAVPATATSRTRTFVTPTPSSEATAVSDTANNTTNSQLQSTPTPIPTIQVQDPNTVLAQAEDTPDSGYPAPPPTTTIPTEESRPEGYEFEQPFVPAETATAYPEGYETPTTESNPTPTVIAVIGADSQVNDDANNATAANNEDTSSNTVVLWLGFILALIIFIAAIIGSIKLFTRKQA